MNEVFQNFTDATIALLKHPETPAGLRDVLQSGLVEAASDLGVIDFEEGFARFLLEGIFRRAGQPAVEKAR